MNDGREPCPHRIVDDVGGAFAMGALGGSVWHGVKGAKNSPKGQRFLGARSAIAMRAPALGGGFAVWGGLFSTFDCSMQYLRQKEDPLNAIVSGFLTGGVLAARGGPRRALTSAAVGGVLLAMIEGMGIMMGRYFAAGGGDAMPGAGSEIMLEQQRQGLLAEREKAARARDSGAISDVGVAQAASP